MLKIKMETFRSNPDGYFLDQRVGRETIEVTINGVLISQIENDNFQRYDEEMHRAAKVLAGRRFYSVSQIRLALRMMEGIIAE